jgi:hypothetical protein
MQDKVLLHVSDWNYQDKYYNMPKVLLAEFADRLQKADLTKANLGGVWDWHIANKDSGLVERCDESVDHTMDTFFLDWTNPLESVREWEV